MFAHIYLVCTEYFNQIEVLFKIRMVCLYIYHKENDTLTVWILTENIYY